MLNRLALVAALLVFCLGGGTAADPVRPDGEHCVVNVRSDDALNLRAGPGSGHRVLSRLPYARCGLIVTAPCAGAWCPVEDGHYAGWVHRRYIAAVSSATHCLHPRTWPPIVIVRAWPSDGSRVLARFAPGTCGVALLPYRVDGWQKVRTDGWEGWLRVEHILLFGD